MDFEELERRVKEAPFIAHDQLGQVPATGGVYAAWLDDEPQCFYVGRAGNLHRRLESHFSGSRASDRFCLYVYDVYIHDERCRISAQMTTTAVNSMTRDWIRRRVRFQWVELDEGEASNAERELRLMEDRPRKRR